MGGAPEKNRRWIFGLEGLWMVPWRKTDGGFLVLEWLGSQHSSFWRSDYKNRRGLFALGRVDHLAFPILYLERAGCVAQVGQMAELLVCEIHLSKG